MPTRKEDNDDERQARIDEMLEEHQKQLERSVEAKILAQRAQVRARIAHALVESRRRREQSRRTRKRA
jgi:hypothetical protein